MKPLTQQMNNDTNTVQTPIIEVKNLTKYFPIYKGLVAKKVGQLHAIDDISFNINTGETFGLVGESGCGKSTTGRVLLRLLDPTSGEVYFERKKISDLSYAKLRPLRREMQIVFQDSLASLNPRLTIGELIGEPLEVHNICNGKERIKRVKELLDAVGLRQQMIYNFPHEMSGGMRQRVGIARALALKPKFIVADEPVSALDVSIRSQVVNLLKDLQEEFKLTYLFIGHDMAVIKHICDRVAVMYLGKIVELAEKKELFNTPKHPYTKALLSAIPIPDPKKKKQRIILTGDVPNPINLPSGCRFHPRCPEVQEICRENEPALREGTKEHWVSCHFAE